MLVQRVEAEAKSAGGILLPESAKEKPKEGIVIALGEGRMLESGDRVLFTSYGGTDVKYAGQEYLIMEERDILAVIN
ncbi:UNVERIFIED_CONTAM: hypothetical protein GTU68_054865 [Idotea baltica]|nr:hypothetical protein [Idotea baltica]